MASLCLAAAVTARAEDVPGISPAVFLGAQYDSNLFRLPDRATALARLGTDDRSVSDFHYGAGIDAGIPLSQQFIDLNLHAIRHHFSDMASLDYTDTLAAARWNWQYGSLWSGDLDAKYHEDISPFDEIQLPERDLRRQYGAQAAATRRLSIDWDAGISVAHDAFRHDLADRKFLDRDIERGTADLTYHGTRDSEDYLGLRVSSRWIHFPSREVVEETQLDNSYRQQEFLGRLKWVLSGRSTVTADAGYSALHHEQFSNRDFRGPTGSLGYRFEPREDTGLELNAWREIDIRTETTASYMTESGLRISPFWNYSSRITLEAAAAVMQRRFEGDPLISLSDIPTRRDTVRLVEISATYSPYDTVQLKLTAHTERRNSNQDSKDYDYTLLDGELEIHF